MSGTYATYPIVGSGGGGGGGGVWGAITGDIQDQTDLQDEFATKWDITGNSGAGSPLLLSALTVGRGINLTTADTPMGSGVQPGNINITLGSCDPAGSSNSGGSLSLSAGAGWDGTATAPGGAGIGFSGGTPNYGGTVNLYTGAFGSLGGAVLAMNGSNGAQSGDWTFSTGLGLGGATAATLQISAIIDSTAGGSFTWNGGDNDSNSVNFTTHAYSFTGRNSTTGNGGNALFNLGNSQTAGSPSTGGNFGITAGAGWDGSYQTGSANFFVGGGGGVVSGDIVMTAGNATGLGDTFGTGGNAILKAGANNGGGYSYMQIDGRAVSSAGDINFYPSDVSSVVFHNGGSSSIQSHLDLVLLDNHYVCFSDTASNFVFLHAPTNLASTYYLMWPTDTGNGGLTNDGSGNLSWVTYAPTDSATFTNITNFSGPAFLNGGARFPFNTNTVLCTNGDGDVISVPSGSIGPVVNTGGGSFTYFQTGTSGSSAWTQNISANAWVLESTSTGGIGTTEYSIPDIVACLKNMYALAA